MRYLLLAALLWSLGRAAAEPWLADRSFEVGAPGCLLRSGTVVPQPHRIRLQEGDARDGRWAIRLAARDADGLPVLQLPPLSPTPAGPRALSLHARAERGEAALELAVVDPAGRREQALFAVTPAWRRYVLTWDSLPGDDWRVGEVRAEGGAVLVDAVQLDSPEAQPFRRPAALGVELLGRPLPRRAGERLTFRFLLSWPEERPVAVSWRLEDPFGALVQTGARDLDPRAGRAEALVRIEHPPPGAYRLTARCAVAGETLEADASAVVVAWDLGGPEPWFGVTGRLGEAGREIVELLRIGFVRGVLQPGEELTTGARAELIRLRRAGLGRAGYLPRLPPDPAAAAAVAAAAFWRAGSEVGTWETAPGDTPAPEVLQAVVAAAATVRSRPYLLLDQLPTERTRWPLWSAAGHPYGDAARLTAPAAEADLAPLIAEARELLAARRPAVRLGVLLPAVPATAWERALVGRPTAGLATPLEQAGRLTRATLLARFAGADGVFYEGPPVAEGPDLSLTAPPTGALSDPAGRPLPALAAVDHLLDRLRGRTPGEQLEPAPGVIVLRWLGRRPLAVVWQAAPADEPRELRLALPVATLLATDLFGHPETLLGGAEARVRLSPWPLWLEPRTGGHGAFVAALRGARVTPLYLPPTAPSGTVPPGAER